MYKSRSRFATLAMCVMVALSATAQAVASTPQVFEPRAEQVASPVNYVAAVASVEADAAITFKSAAKAVAHPFAKIERAQAYASPAAFLEHETRRAAIEASLALGIAMPGFAALVLMSSDSGPGEHGRLCDGSTASLAAILVDSMKQTGIRAEQEAQGRSAALSA